MTKNLPKPLITSLGLCVFALPSCVDKQADNAQTNGTVSELKTETDGARSVEVVGRKIETLWVSDSIFSPWATLFRQQDRILISDSEVFIQSLSFQKEGAVTFSSSGDILDHFDSWEEGGIIFDTLNSPMYQDSPAWPEWTGVKQFVLVYRWPTEGDAVDIEIFPFEGYVASEIRGEAPMISPEDEFPPREEERVQSLFQSLSTLRIMRDTLKVFTGSDSEWNRIERGMIAVSERELTSAASETLEEVRAISGGMLEAGFNPYFSGIEFMKVYVRKNSFGDEITDKEVQDQLNAILSYYDGGQVPFEASLLEIIDSPVAPTELPSL